MRYLLSHLIEESANRFPSHIAVRCRDKDLTYEALVERSSQVANWLQRQGLNRGDRVGLLLNKSLESVIALYGIMRAGGCYVPLDPSAPVERQAFVIRDCGIQHLISAPNKIAALKTLLTGSDIKSVLGVSEELPCDTAAWESMNSEPKPSPINVVEQDLSYILYTSGSTGVPKGIVHTHRSALAWAEVSADAYDLSHEDRISNYAPLHFDLSTLDFFAGALAGCTTVMIPEEYARLSASLCQLISNERLTVFYTVPLALTQLVLSGLLPQTDLSHLRWVLFGGEPMPVKYLVEMMNAVPGARFVNVYGPTETNGCTHHEITGLTSHVKSAPIGKPYKNVDTLVLGQDDQSVEYGEVGELLVRAPTMMQGYWGRQDLNQRACYVREVAPGIHQRYHRTGDLVRQSAGGELDFVGRKDRQIKSRGCRVELDEVEAVLLTHEHITEAAVFAVKGGDGHLEIRACVIAQHELSFSDIKKLLKARLPVYAIPARIDILDDFPRTSTGKIDRLSLQKQQAVELVV